MPHALFLGSSLATQNRVGRSFLAPIPGGILREEDEDPESLVNTNVRRQETRLKRFCDYLASLISAERIKEDWEENTVGTIDRIQFIRAHLKNAIIDIGEHALAVGFL
jgi:hypothetical protein